MTPREMLRRYFHGSDYHCDDLINALTSSGCRILGPGEWDKETLEKCAEVAASFADQTDYDLEPEAAVAENVTAKGIATAIRALAKEKQG